MKKGISRREFLKGSAAGAVSLAAMGLLGGCAQEKEAQPDVNPSQLENTETGELPWLGKAPEIVESEIEKTIEVDVIVVGAGLAGVAATRSAAEEGASVAVFEKRRELSAGAGNLRSLTDLWKRAGGRDNMDVEEIVDLIWRNADINASVPLWIAGLRKGPMFSTGLLRLNRISISAIRHAVKSRMNLHPVI